MLNNGYVKKFRHSYLRNLKKNHTSAFLILDTIADHAKRKIGEGNPLLEIGEAIITAEECGLSPQKFETGLKFLEAKGLIEIIHRGRKDKKSKILPRIKPESTKDSIQINSRINGTVAKLLDSVLYDINIEHAPNHIPNQTRINSGFTPNKEEIKEIRNKEEEYIYNEKIHPIEKLISNEVDSSIELLERTSDNVSYGTDFQEVIENSVLNSSLKKVNKNPSNKKRKKSEVPESERLRFGEYVWFESHLYEKVCQDLGKEIVHYYIEKINAWIPKKGHTGDYYSSYSQTIRDWYTDAKEKGNLPKISKEGSKNEDSGVSCNPTSSSEPKFKGKRHIIV